MDWEEKRKHDEKRYQQASTGDPQAMFEIGQEYQSRRFYEPAKEWYTKAAEKGYLDATIWLADLLVNQGEYEEAYKWLMVGVENDHPIALMNYAKYLLETAQDKEKAENLLKRAIAKGNNEATAMLGRLYEKEGRLDEAIHWFRIGALSGSVYSLRQLLPLLYERELKGEIEEWTEKIIASEDLQLYNKFARFFFKIKDLNKAIKLYEKAALMEDVQAMINLSIIYLGQDKKDKAKKWLNNAVSLGSQEAKSNLGAILYREGDKERGEQLMTEAAQAGIIEAKFNLGVLLYDDSPFMALKWLEEAANEGIDEARELYEELAKQLEKQLDLQE